MLPDRVSNPGPLTYESDALPIALRGPATVIVRKKKKKSCFMELACQYLVVKSCIDISFIGAQYSALL